MVELHQDAVVVVTKGYIDKSTLEDLKLINHQKLLH